MGTLGKTTTPTWPTFGWIQQSQKAVAIAETVPSPGAVFTSVTFWASCDGGTADYIWGCIWDSSGNILRYGSGVLTTGGITGSGHVGATQWYTDTLSSPLFVASGTSILIGWQPNSSTHTTDWAYNGGDHSPNAVWSTASGTPGNHTFTTQSPNGAVAVYATYTPAGGYVSRSGIWTAGEADRRASGAFGAGPDYVRRSGVWQPGS
jgi:hypothetical protein